MTGGGASRAFDRIVVVDWSGRSTPSPARPSADAIWIAVAGPDGCETHYFRTRAAAIGWLANSLEAERGAGRRVLAGFDFSFGYPRGFAPAICGQPSALALWDWLAEHVRDGDDNANNRFELAASLNARLPAHRPFWGRPPGLDLPDLPAIRQAHHDEALPERRAVELRVPRAQSCWKLYTTGSVGSQILMGLPRLVQLRARFGPDLAVWPFEPADTPIVLAEVYPSLLSAAVSAATGPDDIADEVQSRVLATALWALQSVGGLDMAMAQPEGAALAEEGWILGVGVEDALLEAAGHGPSGAALSPPPLRDDCFALPAGVEWTPVDEALGLLEARLKAVTGLETVAVAQADGRILARDAIARRSNPPGANSAVDGYGMAHAATGKGPQSLPLAAGRAAAGGPYQGTVPEGHALRILTGALLPDGVDTVILEEDTTTDGRQIAFHGPLRRGANTRRAGEDAEAGTVALRRGQQLRAPDLALLSALGLPEIPVHRRLRVGVLSTGDELAAPGSTEDPARTYDANRPMLLSLAARWGHEPVDIGHVGDDRPALRAVLERAARQADVLLTSGGASAGDEDHISALLRETGALQAWRIALKPGRPLALGMWDGLPVFGLPGNPVAAFTCALIFGRPALSVLAGGGWLCPQGFAVPAAFEKRKKPGRREYLRARLDAEGRAEIFRSEGSGRISGLSWATGFVELPDGAVQVCPGDAVHYLPYSGFGL